MDHKSWFWILRWHSKKSNFISVFSNQIPVFFFWMRIVFFLFQCVTSFFSVFSIFYKSCNVDSFSTNLAFVWVFSSFLQIQNSIFSNITLFGDFVISKNYSNVNFVNCIFDKILSNLSHFIITSDGNSTLIQNLTLMKF